MIDLRGPCSFDDNNPECLLTTVLRCIQHFFQEREGKIRERTV